MLKDAKILTILKELMLENIIYIYLYFYIFLYYYNQKL